MPGWSARADPTRYVPPGGDSDGYSRRKSRTARWLMALGAVSVGVALLAGLFV